MSISRLPPGYKQEPPSGRVIDSKIYIGIVKANNDAQNMGRLQVWIPEIGGDPEKEDHRFTVSYASPFAGVTNFDKTLDPITQQVIDLGVIKDGKKYGDAQESYGFWFVPPDINNQVLVTFINGEAGRGFWFACLWHQYRNHMTPGIPYNVSTEPKKGVHCDNLGPVTEYNFWDTNANPPDPPRPPFKPLVDGLCKEGLFSDTVRGPSNSGARREAPSKVFGIKSPRGHHFVIDDDEANEFIRLRTRSGTQILINDTTGFVYINSGKGNSWVEISDDAIDIYSQQSINVRSEADINFRADGDINMDAKGSINVRTETGSDINMASGGDTNIASLQALAMQSQGAMDIKTGGALHVQSDGTLSLLAGTSFMSQALVGTHSTLALGNIYRNSILGQIRDNSLPIANVAPPATGARVKTPIALQDIVPGDDCCGTPASRKTIVSRMPTHEPFPHHPRSTAKPAVRTKLANIVPNAGIDNLGGGFAIKVRPGEGLDTTPPPPKTVTTGSGENRVIPSDPLTQKTVDVSGKKVPAAVVAALQEASDITGVRFGYLMAICEVESTFNPNAKAPTSSALGLFQFITGTWEQMIATKDASGQTYGALYGIGSGDRTIPRASAIMGALFTKQNAIYLAPRIARDPTDTDLYMAHFLGRGGAAKFLTADESQAAADIMGSAVASANQSIFYRGGTPLSISQVYANFQSKIDPKARAYALAFPSSAASAEPA